MFAVVHPEARPRVRASAACIHGARSAPRARALVATPPLVAARAKRAPAARQGDMARAGYFLPSQSARPRREWLWRVLAGGATWPLRLPTLRRHALMAAVLAAATSTASIRARVNAAPAAARVVLASGRPRVDARRATGAVRISATAADAETTSAPAAEEDGVREFFDAQMVDEAGMLAASTFPIPPADLIAKCKLILAKNNGGEDPSLLASDFKFVAPVVGPLEKERFLAAFQSFKIDEGFPDAKFNYYHFRVDPFEPSRVWYDARFVGTNTGPLIGGTLPATNKKVESPPQSCSMCFNERGECTQLTVGYVMDKQLGNTGGLGGVYGILYAIGYGLPFPEAQPWQKSVQYDLFQRFSGATQELQKFVKGLTGGN